MTEHRMTTPLDPDSDKGRRVAQELTELVLDVEERLEREKAEAAYSDTG